MNGQFRRRRRCCCGVDEHHGPAPYHTHFAQTNGAVHGPFLFEPGQSVEQLPGDFDHRRGTKPAAANQELAEVVAGNVASHEIKAQDFSRAVTLYQKILNLR